MTESLDRLDDLRPPEVVKPLSAKPKQRERQGGRNGGLETVPAGKREGKTTGDHGVRVDAAEKPKAEPAAGKPPPMPRAAAAAVPPVEAKPQPSPPAAEAEKKGDVEPKPAPEAQPAKTAPTKGAWLRWTAAAAMVLLVIGMAAVVMRPAEKADAPSTLGTPVRTIPAAVSGRDAQHVATVVAPAVPDVAGGTQMSGGEKQPPAVEPAVQSSSEPTAVAQNAPQSPVEVAPPAEVPAPPEAAGLVTAVLPAHPPDVSAKVAAAERTRPEPKKPSRAARGRLAADLVAQRKYREAESEYLDLLKSVPDDATVHYNLGILYDDKLKNAKKAADHYREYLRIEPEGSDAGKVQEWLTKIEDRAARGSRAADMVAQNRFREAEKEYLYLLELDPYDAEVHYNLGILYEDKLKKGKKAAEHYRQYLRIRPEAPDASEVRRWLTAIEEDAR